jgi:hypothetical protein
MAFNLNDYNPLSGKSKVYQTFSKSQMGKDYAKAISSTFNLGPKSQSAGSRVTGTASSLARTGGDLAYQLFGGKQFKDAGTDFSKGNYASSAGNAGMGLLFSVPFLGKAAKVSKLSQLEKASKLPSTRFMNKNNPSIISKFAPNTVNKSLLGYYPIGSGLASGFGSQPTTQSNTSFTQPQTIAGQVQTTAKPTTLPNAINKYNTGTTSASIPASNSNQIYAGGTSTAPTYQAPASYPINPTNTVNTTTLEGINAASGVQSPAGTTVDTSGTAQTGLSPQVQAQNAAYGAALKQAAAEANIRLQNISNANLTGQQQSMGQAADIYGGRAPAILGQALTGNARALQENMGNEAIREATTQGTLVSGYDEAIRKAVEKQYADLLNIAQNRAAQVAQMSKIQGGRV